MTYHTGTIREIHRQLRMDGYCIAENALRAWVKNGTMKAAFVGKKAYISYKNVLSVLENGTSSPDEEDTSGGIRQIAG